MKALKKSLPVILFFIGIIGAVQILKAQKPPTAKEAVIKNLVDSQQYIFHAQYAIPVNGRQRFLTNDYTISISKDTIISDLPFFGRAYSVPVNSTDGGIKFTSANFDYDLAERKKGGWDITIKTKDAPDVRQVMMTIFQNGTASLQVTSNNRQSISFNGYIKERKLKQ